MPARSRITILLDAQLKEDFFRACQASRQPASEIIRALMEHWVHEASAGRRAGSLRIVTTSRPAQSSPAYEREARPRTRHSRSDSPDSPDSSDSSGF